MTKKKNPVVHFEMPAEDRKRMMDFYAQAFGWESNQLGKEYGDYVVVMTADEDPVTKFPKEPGQINGGFFQKTPDNQYPSVVIGVDDIRQAMKEVEAAGGKIIGGAYKAGEPDDIPGVGLFISFFDTEGNRVGMIQPVMPTTNGK